MSYRALAKNVFQALGVHVPSPIERWFDAATEFRFKENEVTIVRVFQGPGYIDRPWTVEHFGKKLTYWATKEEALVYAEKLAIGDEVE
jgi:hypothetical protein